MRPLSRSLSRSRRGFTLIEILIAIAIVGILLRLALPAYMQSARKSHRVDAKTALLDLAQREERYMSTANLYTTDPVALGYPSGTTFPINVVTGSSTYYTLSVGVSAANGATPPGFAASAVPSGGQASDPCGTYALDNTGKQTVSGSATDCW